MMKHPVFTFLFLITIIWIPIFRVEAQNSPVIERIEVALWPEYDQHAVLVIYRVRLSADTSLPAQVRLPMPVEAGSPFAAAWMDENNRLLNADYKSETQGEWTIVTLTSGSQVAQLEFYIDYQLSGSARSVAFIWPEGFPVRNLSYEIQQPIGAEDFQVVPLAERLSIGIDELEYHQAELGEVLNNQSIRIELSYSNPSNQLTVDTMATSEPLPMSTPVEIEGVTPDLRQLLPWILGGLGLILVVVSGILYFQSKPKPKQVKKRPRSRSRRKAEKGEDQSEVNPLTIYCHQCGKKANVSDRFCRHCGVPLRR